jgi:hypothetical protein
VGVEGNEKDDVVANSGVKEGVDIQIPLGRREVFDLGKKD